MNRFGSFASKRLFRSYALGGGLGTSVALFGLWSDRSVGDEKSARWTLSIGAFCLSKDDPVTKLTDSDYIERMKKLNGKCCGEDSYVVAENKDQIVLAIADGVGGWRKKGIDPSRFSRCLMDQVKKVVTDGSRRLEDVLLESEQILRRAFYELVQVYLKKQGEPFGSSTACIVSLKKREGVIDVSNLGDSGVMVIRKGDVYFRSAVQQSRFNAPYQTTLRPNGDVDDMTPMADITHLNVEDGDIILLATDGLWDNIWEHDLLTKLRSIKTRDSKLIDLTAKDLVMQARDSAASERDSPFAVESQKNGKPYSGGKPDDITVLLAIVIDKSLV